MDALPEDIDVRRQTGLWVYHGIAQTLGVADRPIVLAVAADGVGHSDAPVNIQIAIATPEKIAASIALIGEGQMTFDKADPKANPNAHE